MVCPYCGGVQEVKVEWEVLYRTKCPKCGQIANIHPRYVICLNCGAKIRLELDLLQCPHCGHQKLV